MSLTDRQRQLLLAPPTGVAGSTVRASARRRVDALPDSEDLHAHFDATALNLSNNDSVSTWDDETGNGYDLTQATSADQPTYISDGINGNPSVSFRDEYLDVTFSELTQPNHVFIVYQAFEGTSVSSWSAIYDGESVGNRMAFALRDTNEWAMYAGNTISGGSIDEAEHIGNALYDGGDGNLRIDGSQTVSGDVDSETPEGFRVGADQDASRHTDVDVGEILIYPEDKSDIESEVEEYLSDKWGISLA